MTDDYTPQQVTAWLGRIPELCALLPDAERTRSTIDGPRPAPASRPPARLDVIDLLDGREKHDWEQGMGWCDPDRQGVLPYLHGWVRDLEASAYDVDSEPSEPPEHPTIVNLCDWLTRHIDLSANLPQWADYAWGVGQVHHRLVAATRAVADKTERPVPCGMCSGPLTRVDGGQALWQCEDCGHEVTVQAVTINQAAGLMGVPKSSLYALINRPGLIRELNPIAGDERGKRLYDVGELRRLWAEAKIRGTA